MGRTTVNLIGNCVATVVVARWENQFDYKKMNEFISNNNSEYENIINIDKAKKTDIMEG